MSPITTTPYWRLRRNTWVVTSWRRWFLRGSTVACSQKRCKYTVQTVTLVVVEEGVGFIRTSNTTHLFIILSVKSLSRGKHIAKDAQNTNSEPRTSTRYKFDVEQDVCHSITADWSQKEIGPAKSCVCSLSRRNPVATFCFLFCRASSSLPSWSKRHTTLKASAVPQAMEGARKCFSQLGERERKLGRSYTLELPESSQVLG